MVNSTLIKRVWAVSPAVERDGVRRTKVLVEFHKSENLYVYDMPMPVLEGMMQATSIGQYFLKHIKPNPEDYPFEIFREVVML